MIILLSASVANIILGLCVLSVKDYPYTQKKTMGEAVANILWHIFIGFIIAFLLWGAK